MMPIVRFNDVINVVFLIILTMGQIPSFHKTYFNCLVKVNFNVCGVVVGLRPERYWSATIGVYGKYVKLFSASWTENRGFICQHHCK